MFILKMNLSQVSVPETILLVYSFSITFKKCLRLFLQLLFFFHYVMALLLPILRLCFHFNNSSQLSPTQTFETVSFPPWLHDPSYFSNRTLSRAIKSISRLSHFLLSFQSPSFHFLSLALMSLSSMRPYLIYIYILGWWAFKHIQQICVPFPLVLK